MKQKLLNVVTAIAITTASLGVAAPALADEASFANRIALAYAPEENADQGQFDQFQLHGDYDDAHELNDAWLGMPVRDEVGEVIGYVEDAFLDQNGYLTELLVSINGSGVAVYVDQEHVEYTELAVLVDLPVRVIASLEQEEGYKVE